MCVCVSEYLESSQEGSEDVDLDGLLPGALGLPHTLPKVGQQLLPVLACHRGERPTEEDDGGVDDSHAKWEGPGEGRTLQIEGRVMIMSLYLQQGYLVPGHHSSFPGHHTSFPDHRASFPGHHAQTHIS